MEFDESSLVISVSLQVAELKCVVMLAEFSNFKYTKDNCGDGSLHRSVS